MYGAFLLGYLLQGLLRRLVLKWLSLKRLMLEWSLLKKPILELSMLKWLSLRSWFLLLGAFLGSCCHPFNSCGAGL